MGGEKYAFKADLSHGKCRSVHIAGDNKWIHEGVGEVMESEDKNHKMQAGLKSNFNTEKGTLFGSLLLHNHFKSDDMNFFLWNDFTAHLNPTDGDYKQTLDAQWSAQNTDFHVGLQSKFTLKDNKTSKFKVNKMILEANYFADKDTTYWMQLNKVQ